MNIALQAEKISANDLTWALFDLNNQIDTLLIVSQKNRRYFS